MLRKYFVHLHCHSNYSLLDGHQSIDDIIQWCLDNNCKHVALTDHGFMYGSLEFYRKAKKAGLNPIIGLETYYTTRGAGNTELGAEERNYQTHLTLLAKSTKGYRNLLKVASLAATVGQYYRPCVDDKILREYSEDIICLSGCISGLIPKLLYKDRWKEAEERALVFRDIFGDNFYLEVQKHPVLEFSENPTHRKQQEEFVKMQDKALDGLKRLSSKLGIPMVATNDAHYTKREDAKIHDVVIAMGSKEKLDDPERFRYSTDQFYMKTTEEMLKIFPPDVVYRSWDIAEQCDVHIEEAEQTTYLMPVYPNIPEGLTEREFLDQLTQEGLKRLGLTDKEEYQGRLEKELGVIHELGWDGYFLILWDVVGFCEKNGIPVGVGRGSSCGSLVSYALGITKADPIEHNLLFERFLSPNRVGPPDIDLDISKERRQEVIDYVVDLYGRENVAQINTIGLLKTKAAIKKVATAYSLKFSTANLLTSYIPSIQTQDMCIEKALEIPEIRQMYNKDPLIKEVVDVAKEIEDSPQFSGVHAAAVVISPVPLSSIVPVRQAKEALACQWTMDEVESIGLLKMDFLGLRTLDVIDYALDEIERNRGIKIRKEDIPMDDEETYNLLSRADVSGVFQMESKLCRNYLKMMKPEKFSDVEAFTSLIRPGPLDAPAPSGDGTMVDEYIRRLHGQSPAIPPHPMIESVLKDTYQVIVFQEQLMRITQKMAGYTASEADVFRKVVGKKKLDEMEEQRGRFIEGCSKNGIKESDANAIFNLMETFGNYGFNKSHATAYSMTAIQTAWLRAHYYPEFMAATLSSIMNEPDRLTEYLKDCHAHGVSVLPPSINLSTKYFVTSGENIHFGLSAVKHVGEASVNTILEDREKNGEYKSFKDFFFRVYGGSVNKTALTSLVRCGVFDGLGYTRKQLEMSIEPMIKAFNSYRGKIKRIEDREATFANGALVNGIEEIEEERKKLQKRRVNAEKELDERIEKALGEKGAVEEYSLGELTEFEKELLGLYLTHHPIDEYQDFCISLMQRPEPVVTSLNIEENIGKHVIACGYVSSVVNGWFSNGKKTEFALEDKDGSIQVVAYAQKAEMYKDFVEEGNVVVVEGRVVHYDNSGVTWLRADSVDFAQKEPLPPVVIIYTDSSDVNNVLNELKVILAKDGFKYNPAPTEDGIDIVIHYVERGITKERRVPYSIPKEKIEELYNLEKAYQVLVI